MQKLKIAVLTMMVLPFLPMTASAESWVCESGELIREIAIKRMKRALSEFKIEGIKTSIPFQQEIIDHPDFINGKYGIEWVANFIQGKGY